MEGEISVHGSKNGALPVMAGALLHKGVTVLLNVPDIEDTRCMVDILKELGCSCKKRRHKACDRCFKGSRYRSTGKNM